MGETFKMPFGGLSYVGPRKMGIKIRGIYSQLQGW